MLLVHGAVPSSRIRCSALAISSRAKRACSVAGRRSKSYRLHLGVCCQASFRSKRSLARLPRAAEPRWWCAAAGLLPARRIPAKFAAARVGASQEVRQRILIPPLGGSNPRSPASLLRRRRRGLFSPAEARRVGAVEERVGALGGQVFEPVDRAVDVVLPHLARHFVKELDTVAVRVVDVD